MIFRNNVRIDRSVSINNDVLDQEVRVQKVPGVLCDVGCARVVPS